MPLRIDLDFISKKLNNIRKDICPKCSHDLQLYYNNELHCMTCDSEENKGRCELASLQHFLYIQEELQGSPDAVDLFEKGLGDKIKVKMNQQEELWRDTISEAHLRSADVEDYIAIKKDLWIENITDNLETALRVIENDL